jgi:hypothetical protein
MLLTDCYSVAVSPAASSTTAHRLKALVNRTAANCHRPPRYADALVLRVAHAVESIQGIAMPDVSKLA